MKNTEFLALQSEHGSFVFRPKQLHQSGTEIFVHRAVNQKVPNRVGRQQRQRNVHPLGGVRELVKALLARVVAGVRVQSQRQAKGESDDHRDQNQGHLLFNGHAVVHLHFSSPHSRVVFHEAEYRQAGEDPQNSEEAEEYRRNYFLVRSDHAVRTVFEKRLQKRSFGQAVGVVEKSVQKAKRAQDPNRR